MKIKEVEVNNLTIGYGETVPSKVEQFRMHRFYFEPTISIKIELGDDEEIDFDELFNHFFKKVAAPIKNKISRLKDANML